MPCGTLKGIPDDVAAKVTTMNARTAYLYLGSASGHFNRGELKRAERFADKCGSGLQMLLPAPAPCHASSGSPFAHALHGLKVGVLRAGDYVLIGDVRANTAATHCEAINSLLANGVTLVTLCDEREFIGVESASAFMEHLLSVEKGRRQEQLSNRGGASLSLP